MIFQRYNTGMSVQYCSHLWKTSRKFYQNCIVGQGGPIKCWKSPGSGSGSGYIRLGGGLR